MKSEQSCVETPEKQDVDLELVDVNTGGENLEKDCDSGERNHMSVLINSSSCAGGLRATETKHDFAMKNNIATKRKEDAGVGKCAEDVKENPSNPSDLPKSEDCLNPGDKSDTITQPEVSKRETEDTPSDEDCGDDYPCGRRSESDDYDEEEDDDDDVTLVLSDDCVPCVTEDECHYITTHEILLSELSDQHEEEDCDLRVGSSTSTIEDDNNQVYSFVDYAPLDAALDAASVSTLLESDPCDLAKFTSSDESVSKPQQQQQEQQCNGNSAGQIHLSIRATSRAINDPGSIQEQGNILYHARRSGDTSRYVFSRGVDGNGKAETLCEGIANRKLRGKEVTDYSSGASSDLDDADKEVRNLTAKTFKSLAYPYFNAINFSTSSESSASEHGKGTGIRNRWSTFVDLKYGNMSKGLDQSVVSHQNSFAKNLDNRGYKGIALASIKPPPKIFTLNGNSSSKQIEELMHGEFSQGGVIRLTETLNFRCNVKSGMHGGERHTKFAEKFAAGSRSTDEVTNRLPSTSSQRKGRGASNESPCKTMEDTHKKAIFASSLIKNVISKKMQFEQERKMERGEIRETHPKTSPCVMHQELHRQSSKFSESSSDYAIMLDELGDMVDSGSCDTRSDSRRHHAPETNLEPPTNEAWMIDTKKSALEASKTCTLLRSQNSAFRCWKDEELELQKKDHKNDTEKSANEKEDEGDQYSAGKPTKMSHLFVPSIQLLSSEGEVGQEQLQDRSYSPYGDGDGTVCIEDSRTVATSKSPEIKINLRCVRYNKKEPFGVSKLRAPNIGCNAASSLIRTDDSKCQALAAALQKGESTDKVPHFMVRDIRDNKGKLQTPIHQVRDVRKLVKSSYHFVSLDNNENNKSADSEQKKQMSYRNPNSVSPIVIKCQSVNTNNNGKYSDLTESSKQETLDMDRSSPEGARNAPLQRAAERRAPSDGVAGLSIESKTGSKKQEKTSDITDKKPESKMANQGALEKLQAAVKTMEQLYKFEKNEWKRRNETHLLGDGSLLSLIAREDHGGPEEEGARGFNMDRIVRRDSYPNNDKTPPARASPGTDGLLMREDKDLPMVFQTPSTSREDRLVARSMQASGTAGNKNMFSLSSSLKTSTKMPKPNAITQTPFSAKSFVPKSPKLPVSSRNSQRKLSGNERAESKEAERSIQELFSASADNENYLTIPVKSHASRNKPAASSADKTSVYTYSTQTQPTTPTGHLGSSARGFEDHYQSPQRSSIVMDTRSPEIPPATIYHSLPYGMSTNQPQVYCFSPAITPAPTLDPFQATQRKMLLDPTTGNYYLVDTPVQPATKRLFDPETGQYVDVPMPQAPMTPVPMPISPLALSPAAYGHTYMIYPGFMPTPSVIPARTLVHSHMSVQSEAEGGERALSQQTEGMYMESPFYMATGKSPLQAAYAAQQQATVGRPPHGLSGVKQPVISITSQQGPRIIAPPSFDGTTMSFVVEHR
ncbi:uncharacterized protein C4orf54 homolog [Sebastes fasciatus]|uniref:uncharacterized protein C4orf54 homolog n=1 Tax=Sebastes fasciatus TaxID=394691 RepID=UPI003D9F8B3C